MNYVKARECEANSSIDDLALNWGTAPIFSQVNKSWQPHHLIIMVQLQYGPFITVCSWILQIQKSEIELFFDFEEVRLIL